MLHTFCDPTPIQVEESTILEIHDAASDGDIPKLTALLNRAPTDIELLDQNGWTPIFYAASMQKIKTIDFLLERGANPYVVDDEQFNIVEYAKINNKHTRASKYLKNKIGFNKNELEKFYKKFYDIFLKEFEITKKLDKKILILIGETHGDYKIYQLEKMLLKAVQSIKINVLYGEHPSDSPALDCINIFAESRLGMSVIGIDNYPNTNEAFLPERNKIMAKEIESNNANAVFIVGSDHLYGLMEDEATRINPEQFYVVSLNLSPCVYDNVIDSIESKFSHSSNVIQVALENEDAKTIKIN